MPACIFLLPNSILSQKEASKLGNSAFPVPLKELLEGFGAPKTAEIFANPALEGFATMQWVWMLLTMRDVLAPTAPYLWKGLKGPKVHQEIWALNGYSRKDGELKSSGDIFDLDEECDLRDLLNPLARKFGLEVQVLDGRFFLARKTSWEVLITPWPAQCNKPAAQPEGPAAASFLELTGAIESALKDSDFNDRRRAAGRGIIDGFWINGGGFEEQLLPYTQIRCAMTEDPTVIGIAEASGIARRYIRPASENWPDCPEGDRFCILNEFQDPGIKEDPKAWETAWERTVNRISELTAAAKGFEKYYPRLVASDGLAVSIIEKPAEKKSSFVFWKKEKNHTEAWLCPSASK